MKKILLLAALFVAIFFVGCQTAPAAHEASRQAFTPEVTIQVDAAQGEESFDNVLGKEWKLVDVLLDGRNVGFSRDLLAAKGFRDAFTLQFDTGSLGGAAAPNRYFAQYTLSEDRGISVGLVAGTRMAPIAELEQLREHDYLFFVQSIYRWSLAGGKLELSSRGRNDEAVKLVFQQ